jgi:hypothetical protein
VDVAPENAGGTVRARFAVACGAVIAWLAAGCAAPEPPVEAPLPAPAVSTFTFAEGSLGYDGRSIPFPCSEDALFELLGPPSRRESTGNLHAVWDELGVVSYIGRHGKRNDLVTSLTLHIQPRGAWFSPATCFRGDIVLPGGTLNPDSTPEDVLAAGLRTPMGLGDSWSCHVGRFGLLAEHDGRLTSMSFSWRGPDPQHVAGPPLGPDEMFRAESRAYDFPFDESFQEIERRGNVSVLRHESHGSGGTVGRSFFACGAMGELARRLGWTHFVVLASREAEEASLPTDARCLELVVGFTNDAEPDFLREFPHDALQDHAYAVMTHDFLLDLFGDWPDGGRPWKGRPAGDP